MSTSRKYRTLLAIGGVPVTAEPTWRSIHNAFAHQLAPALSEDEFAHHLGQLFDEKLITVGFAKACDNGMRMLVKVTEKGWNRYCSICDSIRLG